MSSVLFDLFLRKVQILLLFAMSLVCLSDYEARASTIIAKPAWDYYRSGAGHETTLNLNRGYFQRYYTKKKRLTVFITKIPFQNSPSTKVPL